MKLADLLVDPDQLYPFSPPKHANTLNHRLWPRHENPSDIEVIHGFLGHGGGADPHFHSVSDQMVYMLSGELKIIGNEDSVIMQAGQFIFIPKGLEHRVEVLSQDGANIIVMYMPRLSVSDILPAKNLQAAES
ncbi:MAG: cupin domain-containing protein [Roseibium sp.]|uniref:cupin domain-containing protein n=1 Tax=Roseibium sp. TaxID=1936156 RepID=UPI003D9C6598